MRRLLRKLLGRQAGASLELISVHVPKTAGTSFRQVLEHVYGPGLQPIYTPAEGNPEIWQGRVPPIHAGTRAIHGHFPATETLRRAFPQARLVAWVRDPLERVISFFNHWSRGGNPANPNYAYFVENQCTLVEFAGLDFMQNEMLGYLTRVPLEAFDFIGLTESFDSDIRRLAKLMDWDLPDLPRANVSARKQRPDASDMAALREVMREEIEFYEDLRRRRA